jgi:hypothetical protein
VFDVYLKYTVLADLAAPPASGDWFTSYCLQCVCIPRLVIEAGIEPETFMILG